MYRQWRRRGAQRDVCASMLAGLRLSPVKELKCEAASVLSLHTTVEREWTEVAAGLHLGAQDGLEHDVHKQQGQAVQYLGPLSSVRKISEDDGQGCFTQQMEKDGMGRMDAVRRKKQKNQM